MMMVNLVNHYSDCGEEEDVLVRRNLDAVGVGQREELFRHARSDKVSTGGDLRLESEASLAPVAFAYGLVRGAVVLRAAHLDHVATGDRALDATHLLHHLTRSSFANVNTT